MATPFVATEERTGPLFPLLLTTGRILSQYNVGAQTRRTPNVVWHDRGRPGDPRVRRREPGIRDGAEVTVSSRVGSTVLTARISDRVPAGVVYTTFHHPESGANLVTTEFSDWATNCPEYKVTAVEVSPGVHRAPIGTPHGASRAQMLDHIAAQFVHLPDDRALESVVGHVRAFWEPTMIDELLAGHDLTVPLAVQARDRLRGAALTDASVAAPPGST
ncbi:MAG: formate dehydrogenase subunit delta [Ilumatobacteraceae bacterium]